MVKVIGKGKDRQVARTGKVKGTQGLGQARSRAHKVKDRQVARRCTKYASTSNDGQLKGQIRVRTM